ncbi:MAG: hypothetical protein IJJ80_06240, partial [Clostridia bacterium]|nr:hypothetical protein [Clostridia bacterium]
MAAGFIECLLPRFRYVRGLVADGENAPSALDFEHYGKIAETTEKAFTNQFAYLNLYPNYASVAVNTEDQT